MKKNTLNKLKGTFKNEINRIKQTVQVETNHYINDLSLNGLSREKQAEKLHIQMQSICDDFDKADFKEYFLLSELDEIIFILSKQNDLPKIKNTLNKLKGTLN